MSSVDRNHPLTLVVGSSCLASAIVSVLGLCGLPLRRVSASELEPSNWGCRSNILTIARERPDVVGAILAVLASDEALTALQALWAKGIRNPVFGVGGGSTATGTALVHRWDGRLQSLLTACCYPPYIDATEVARHSWTFAASRVRHDLPKLAPNWPALPPEQLTEWLRQAVSSHRTLAACLETVLTKSPDPGAALEALRAVLRRQ